MLYTHTVLFLSWVLYCTLHSLLAHPPFKKWVLGFGIINSRYYRLFYSFFAMASLVVIVTCQIQMPSILLYKNQTLRLASGLPLMAIGLGLMLVCSRHYFLHIIGMGAMVDKYAAPVLKTDGLHELVRHPLYLSTFVFIAGIFCWHPSVANLIAATIIIGYTLVGIGLEEKKLVAQFGLAYINYQKKVPKLIPFGK